jgi:hypothetical protein
MIASAWSKDMSASPMKTAHGSSREILEDRFHRLASEWLTETAHMSSSSDIVNNPAFAAIIELGDAAVPLLLREMTMRPGHWHRALKRITGTDPVAESDRGDMGRIKEAWLRWGKENGYQW